jgi:CheY-like chemotaxis protein
MAVLQALRNVERWSGGGKMGVPRPQPHEDAPATAQTGPSGQSAREAVAAAMRKFLESRQVDGAGSFEEGFILHDDSDAAPSATDGGVTVPRRRERQTVLFVEDDPDQHAILRLMLAGTGLTPVFACTAARAMQKLATLVPGIILVDVNLPDGSGVDLIRTIKSDAALGDVPIITVTGHRTRQVVLGSMAAGAVDFVAKPYGRDMLLSKLKRAIGEPAHQRDPARA